MNILALDFDGVICDSTVECMVTSRNAYIEVERLPGKKIYKFDNIFSYEAEIFKKFRPAVRIAEEFFYLWKMIKTNNPINTMRDIKVQCHASAKKILEFKKLFFNERQYWMSHDTESWFDCNPLFPGIIESLQPYLSYSNVIIVSSKNMKAISAILRHNGLIIDNDRIFSSDTGIDKEEIFENLSEKYTISCKDVSFIDDNLNNLLCARKMGISVALASWGYSFDNQKILAKKNGIPAIALKNFKFWLETFACSA